jgi:hypothetical protein
MDGASKQSSATARIGDPSQAANLPGELQAAYDKGARDITINPGTYNLPATGKIPFGWNSWSDTIIRANGVVIVFEELKQKPVILKNCRNVTFEGAILRRAEPAFTQGRIVAMGRDETPWIDWQIDAGISR